MDMVDGPNWLSCGKVVAAAGAGRVHPKHYYSIFTRMQRPVVQPPVEEPPSVFPRKPIVADFSSKRQSPRIVVGRCRFKPGRSGHYRKT